MKRVYHLSFFILVFYFVLIAAVIAWKLQISIATINKAFNARMIAIEEIVERAPITSADLWQLLSFMKLESVSFFKLQKADGATVLSYGFHSDENPYSITINSRGANQYTLFYNLDRWVMLKDNVRADFAYLLILSVLSLFIISILPIIDFFRQKRDDEILNFISISTDPQVLNRLNNQNSTINRICNRILELMHEKTLREQDIAIAKKTNEIAKQVSHDIRSPLVALNMIIGQLKEVPEQQRLMLRNSVNRINDIANTLLTKAKEQKNQADTSTAKDAVAIDSVVATPLSLRTELLPALVDAIVSEKRIQFRDKIGIEIEADLQDSYGAFAKINAAEIARVASNLCNNSVEAMPEGKGKFTLSVRKHPDRVILIAKDNGKGIPQHILDKLGQEGVTHGKEGTQSGSGLGVYHAKKTVEAACNGKFEIESQQGQGTIITMTFPAESAPNWFVEKLELIPNGCIVSLDDDLSIHSVWQDRFQKLNISAFGIEHIKFTSSLEFKKWVMCKRSAALYLVDYELLNQNTNGLELIETLGIASDSILVTSRYEEPAIQVKCEKLGVKLIPKGLAPYVPIVVQKQKERLSWVLIDDDYEIIIPMWLGSAKEAGLNVKAFSNPTDFFKAASEIDIATPIYIDVSLANGVKGTDVAVQVAKLGFSEIYLATGYEADSIGVPACVRGVRGKEPPR